MMDSIKSVYLDAYALKYPGIRQVTISHEVVMPGKINTELNGKSLFDGRYWVSKTNANINLPAYRWNKNSIVASIGATHNSFHLNNIKNYNSQFGILPQETSKTTVTTSLSYVRNDSLFGKPVIFNVGATALFNADFSRQRFLYTAVIMFELKRTTTSSLSIGAVFIKDPSATVPFAPLISYWHKISSLEAELFVNAPYRIALRKEFKKKYSITAFTELAGSQAFFNISQPIFPEKSIYATLDLKAGMLAEYRFSKKAVLSFSGGLFKTLSSRMAEQNKNINNDYFLKNNNQMMPYINVGVSLLPFLKSFH